MIGGDPWVWSGHPTPRAWTEACFSALRSAGLETWPVATVVMGAGKTDFIAEMVRRLCTAGLRVLVTVPTVMLVEQTAERIEAACGRRAVGCVYTDGSALGARRQVAIVCHRSIAKYHGSGYTHHVWISDECHRSQEPTMRMWAREHGPARRLGLSATPWRSQDGDTIEAFSSEVYRYGPREALRDGVLVPYDVVTIAGEEGETATDRMLRMWERTPPVGPGVVSCGGIPDAVDLARHLTALGMPARPIHSQLGRSEVRDLQRWVVEGDSTRCLCHVNMLAEGVNIPALRWLALRRRTSNRLRFPQEVGRVLRTAPGKDRAIVYDVHDLHASLRLDYESALGWSAEDEEEREAGEAAEGLLERIVLPDGLMPLQAVEAGAVSEWRAFASSELNRIDLAGVIVRPTMRPDQRAQAPTDAQRRSAGRARQSELLYVPPIVLDVLRDVSQGRGTRGDATDALAIYSAAMRGFYSAPEQEQEHGRTAASG